MCVAAAAGFNASSSSVVISGMFDAGAMVLNDVFVAAAGGSSVVTGVYINAMINAVVTASSSVSGAMVNASSEICKETQWSTLHHQFVEQHNGQRITSGYTATP